MSTIEKDLGIVTAYGFAKSKGYTGTVEEFAKFMAMIPDLFGLLPQRRVKSLNDVELTGAVIEAVGNPIFVKEENLTEYAAFGITKKGWYLFARITAPEGVSVSDETTVTGVAGYIATSGNSYLDVAVKFEVAASAKKVTINWGEEEESFVFRATDLAIRNLDYRVTFYVYDAAKYTIWEYALTTDTTFEADKYYWIKQEDGTYTEAEVTTGDAIPAYYTLAEETYTQATGVFEEGVTYYTKSGTEYMATEVTVGETIPAYYVHSHVTFNGMFRNVTYECNTPVDCPVTFILPEINDTDHGCWFEIWCYFTGAFSMTIVPPSSDVKVASEHTQQEQKGINMINLHYADVAGTKVWRFLNTRSTVPA